MMPVCRTKFPYEPWSVTEDGFRPEELPANESVFALGNGFLGMRGNLEENTAAGAETIQGTFLNGVFDSEPIQYGESGYGYAKNHETICNVMDAKSVVLTADGERLTLGESDVPQHRRTLDLRRGLLERRFLWNTRSGAKLSVTMSRLVSLAETDLAAARVEIECLSGKSELRIGSAIRPAVIAAGDTDDPRTAAGKDRSLTLARTAAEGGLLAMQQRTKRTAFAVSCAAAHRFDGLSRTWEEDAAPCWEGGASLSAGEKLVFEKTICYQYAPLNREAECWDAARARCAAAPGFAELAAAQQAYLDGFWEHAGISIDGDDALLQGLRFNLFHLLQSAGRDGKRSLAAKGLSGEGYEGHTFWDTEAYAVPVFLHTEPTVARKLLEYRHAALPEARERARELGYDKGALFPWRTIDGAECSAYFPAGTAQYHIDADIAKGVWDYWLATGDLDFMAESGAEILIETARFLYALGFYSAAKGGRFVLNCVTGPDEYNALVDNNTYTNRMAAANFTAAADSLALLYRQRPADWRRLTEALALDEEEIEAWREAAEYMYYPAPRDGIYPQDDGFLERKPWPLGSIPAEQRPLLLHYHNLDIYRAMVCKQADLVLEMALFDDEYTPEERKRNLAFYDSVTTHDSSLSMAVFSLLAASAGEVEAAYRYFMDAARLDLDDMQGNTRDGLHMANMAGAWIGIARGFGGMRFRGGTLSFHPVCPKQWKGYAFRVRFRGSTVEVRVTGDGAEYRLVDGAPITIRDGDSMIELH